MVLLREDYSNVAAYHKTDDTKQCLSQSYFQE